MALALLIAGPSRIQFTDVTASSGVGFRHAASKTSVKFLPETMGGGVAIFDADGDGRLDLFFTNGAAISTQTSSNRPPEKNDPRFWNRLYRNLGGWKFEDVTERAGLRGTRYDFGAAVADYDNDGDVDLFVTALGGTTLFRNNGYGTFTDVTTAAGAAVSGWSSSAAFVDYDNDGHLDLYVGRYLAWTWESNIECRSTDNSVRAYCHPRQFAPVSSVLLHNNGDGTFTDASASSGIAAHPGKALGVAIHDFDSDGRIDLFVANDSMPQFLFKNAGAGVFAEVALEAGVAYDDDGHSFAGMGVDAEDFNNDGWPDIIVTALSLERYALYRAVGRGRFEYASHSTGVGGATLQNSGWGTKFVDFDNDGRRDVFVAQGHVLDTVSRARQGFDYLQPPLMLRNQPSTPATDRSLRPGVSFIDVSASLGPAFARPSAGRGAAFADLDDDGDVDIVIANLDGQPTLLRNDGGNVNHWLTVSLRGTRSNRQGIGAIVSVVDEHGLTQSGICSTTSSYQSASDGRVHFGLAGAKMARRVEVRWPSGAVQVLKEIAADRILEIVEPAHEVRQ
ncbi:MAG: CRTAC1 family protein [Vicinamibacterales bacterium]